MLVLHARPAVSLLSLLALVLLVTVPAAWAAATPVPRTATVHPANSRSALGDSHECVVRGGLGSDCDDTCLDNVCTDDATGLQCKVTTDYPTGRSCVAGVCVTDAGTGPAAGCGPGKSCVAGVCVAEAVVPATCAADKPCSGTDTCVNSVCTPATGAQNVCSPACATGTTCVNSVCVATGTFTGTLGSRCDTTHACNANLACFAGFCVPSNLAAEAGGASAVQATVSILASLPASRR